MVFASVASAQSTNAPTFFDPQNPLAPFAQFIGGALALKILAWMGAFRALGKLVSAKLEDVLEAFRVWCKGTASDRDDHFLDRLLMNPFYRGASFLVDYFFSIKFPQADASASAPAPVVVPQTQSPNT